MKNKKEILLSKRPELAGILESSKSLENHLSGIADAAIPLNTDSLLGEAIVEEAGRILKSQISTDLLQDQIRRFPIISYADHHSLLNYKLLYNSNLICSEMMKMLNRPYLIVGATGNIPLKNESFPRGFYFKGRKFNFFGTKDEKTSVYLLEKKICSEPSKGLKSFILNLDAGNLSHEEIKFLHCLFFEGLEIERAGREYECYSDQLTFLNYRLWKLYFNKSIRPSIPDIIYLQTNQLVNRVLIDLLNKENSLVSRILFDPEIRHRYLKHFQGIQGCWSEDRGSHFFWGVGKKKKRVTLQLNDNHGTLEGENFELKLDAASITEAIDEKRILPTLFFDYLINTFLEGFITLGGFNQLNYLPQMRTAHLKCIETFDIKGVSKLFNSRTMGGFVCGMLPFDYDSGIDLIWERNSNNGKFNGNLEGGLTREELNRMRMTEISALTNSAIETMMENISDSE